MGGTTKCLNALVPTQGTGAFFHAAREKKEASMQAVIRFIHEHYYDIFIPVTALALLRLAPS